MSENSYFLDEVINDDVYLSFKNEFEMKNICNHSDSAFAETLIALQDNC